MTQDESDHLVLKLAALFPTMKGEQGVALSKLFLPLEFDAVREGVEEHFKTNKFVCGADLMEQIQRIRVFRGYGKTDRLAAAHREHKARAQRIHDEKANTEHQMIDVFLAVQNLDPDERERHKSAILGRLAPFVAERLKDSDPETSPVLASLIAKQIGAVK